MPSFQGVAIEEFYCIQKCPHSRGLEWRSSTVYRGILISGGWNGGVPLYTEVPSFQGDGIEEFYCIQRCPHSRGLEWRSSTVYRGVLISGDWNRGVL